MSLFKFSSCFLLILLLVLPGCSNVEMNRNRTSIDSIQGRVIGDTLVFGSPCTFITAIGDNLLLSNMNPVEGKAYQIVDFASESFLGTFGNFGAGPGEFLCQEFAGMTADSDTLYAYDISFKHI